MVDEGEIVFYTSHVLLIDIPHCFLEYVKTQVLDMLEEVEEYEPVAFSCFHYAIPNSLNQYMN